MQKETEFDFKKKGEKVSLESSYISLGSYVTDS